MHPDVEASAARRFYLIMVGFWNIVAAFKLRRAQYIFTIAVQESRALKAWHKFGNMYGTFYKWKFPRPSILESN